MPGVTSPVQRLSLEEIEAMLSSDEDEGNDNISEGLKNDEEDPNVDRVDNEDPEPLSAWSQCKSWDPCAIGSFPAQPLFRGCLQ